MNFIGIESEFPYGNNHGGVDFKVHGIGDTVDILIVEVVHSADDAVNVSLVVSFITQN